MMAGRFVEVTQADFESQVVAVADVICSCCERAIVAGSAVVTSPEWVDELWHRECFEARTPRSARTDS
jgi:allantoicase